MAIGASTDAEDLAWYSNTGAQVCVVAPSNGGTRGIFTTDVSTPGRGFNIGAVAAGGADGLFAGLLDEPVSLAQLWCANRLAIHAVLFERTLVDEGLRFDHALLLASTVMSEGTGDRAVLDGARAMAATVADLWAQPGAMEAARAAFETARAEGRATGSATIAAGPEA